MQLDRILEASHRPDEVLALNGIETGAEEVRVTVIVASPEQFLLRRDLVTGGQSGAARLLQFPPECMPFPMPAFKIAQLNFLRGTIAFEDVGTSESGLGNQPLSLDLPVGLAEKYINNGKTPFGGVAAGNPSALSA